MLKALSHRFVLLRARMSVDKLLVSSKTLSKLFDVSFTSGFCCLLIWFYFFHRYCGYCPQFKYQIGDTFGRTTSQLLTTSSVASSGKPVLSDITPQPRPPRDGRRALIATRSLNLGDQKLCDKMVPNYTGKRVK